MVCFFSNFAMFGYPCMPCIAAVLRVGRCGCELGRSWFGVALRKSN